MSTALDRASTADLRRLNWVSQARKYRTWARDRYSERWIPMVKLSLAFTASLAKHRKDGTMPLMPWQHERTEIIGVWENLRQDSAGLLAEGRCLPMSSGAPKLLRLLRLGRSRIKH